MTTTSGWPPIIRALRPRQWLKNLLVAAAPIAAGVLDEGDVFVRTVAAIVCFTAASGAVYLLNDAVDVDIDRLHPTKRFRPIAAGEVSVSNARWLAAALVVGAVGVALLVDPVFAAVLGGYLIVNIAYSNGMKRMPYVELAAVASGFFLRAIAGGAAARIGLSAWFVLVVLSGSLFIVAGKRSAELRRTGGVDARAVLQHYSAASLRAIRAVSAMVAVLAYVLWVVRNDETAGWLAVASLVAFGAALLRYQLAIESGQGEDPEEIFLRDHLFKLAVVVWVVVYAGAVYG